ncbi:hypothetical protein OPU71_16275 [Niveibacterium sp. 24ML]|uniref:hypothetical protein n=1 Tax=Niveibacterium sp. 24ML TaxID=2985512 RepID=UPI00226E9DC0|nr:hypothetical protein [Niveibacterium sp. 24ML]MCX9157684.1 hypothetical protein [Niveibacterium sp. 24ML]
MSSILILSTTELKAADSERVSGFFVLAQDTRDEKRFAINRARTRPSIVSSALRRSHATHAGKTKRIGIEWRFNGSPYGTAFPGPAQSLSKCAQFNLFGLLQSCALCFALTLQVKKPPVTTCARSR